jgi:polar amino acid transport system substrate-binding protein
MDAGLLGQIRRLGCALALALGCLGASLPAWAGEEVTFCFERKDGRPWRTVDGEGLNFDLLRQVAMRLHLTVRYVSLPWKRCLAKLQANEIDGVFSVSFSAERLKLGAFPGGATPDVSKRMHYSRYFLVRRKDGRIDWDGKAFQHVDGVIGYNLGYSIGAFLRTQNAPFEEVNQRPSDLLKLVSVGRIAGAAVFESDMEAVSKSAFAAELEIRPVPLEEKPYYLMLSHAMLATRPQLAQQIWKGIEEARTSAAYVKLYRDAGALPDN